jgi:hypothetical protein
MSVPSARVPSEVSIAHDVFGHLWGLIFLGMVREAIPVPIPFGPVLTRFVNDHSEAIDRIKALILQALRLSSDAMTIFDDTKRNLPDSGQTGDSVAAWLTIYTLNRAPLDLDLGDLALVRRMAQFGVKRQLYGLVEAMAIALAAHPPSELNQVSSARLVVTEAAALAGEPDPGLAARQGYEAWCVAGLTDYLDPSKAMTEEARTELREVVDRLDAAFGIVGEA